MDALTFIIIQITICVVLLIAVVFVGKYLILKFTRTVFGELETVAASAGKQAAESFGKTVKAALLEKRGNN